MCGQVAAAQPSWVRSLPRRLLGLLLSLIAIAAVLPAGAVVGGLAGLVAGGPNARGLALAALTALALPGSWLVALIAIGLGWQLVFVVSWPLRALGGGSGPQGGDFAPVPPVLSLLVPLLVASAGVGTAVLWQSPATDAYAPMVTGCAGLLYGGATVPLMWRRLLPGPTDALDDLDHVV